MAKQTYLILGANGQLGKQFTKELTRRKQNVVAPEEKECDITSIEILSQYFQKIHPTVVINCAAYNAVDPAEQNPGIAYRINTAAVEQIASLCKEHDIVFVHYSSDYVFDGTKGDFYMESDVPNPLNVYGKSKLAGEKAVQQNAGKYLLFRTSWVFGDGTQNFMYKLRQWSQKNPILKISSDEVSVPTSAIDLVEYTLSAVEKGLTGFYHLTNSDYASRYEWARYAVKKMGLNVTVIPVPMSTFMSQAKRPLFSPLSNMKLQRDLGVVIPDWRDAVDRFLESKISEV